MFRTTSIATLMGPFAGETFVGGYATPEMAEIFARAGSVSFDGEPGWPDVAYGRPDCSHDLHSIQVG